MVVRQESSGSGENETAEEAERDAVEASTGERCSSRPGRNGSLALVVCGVREEGRLALRRQLDRAREGRTPMRRGQTKADP